VLKEQGSSGDFSKNKSAISLPLPQPR